MGLSCPQIQRSAIQYLRCQNLGEGEPELQAPAFPGDLDPLQRILRCRLFIVHRLAHAKAAAGRRSGHRFIDKRITFRPNRWRPAVAPHIANKLHIKRVLMTAAHGFNVPGKFLIRGIAEHILSLPDLLIGDPFVPAAYKHHRRHDLQGSFPLAFKEDSLRHLVRPVAFCVHVPAASPVLHASCQRE